MIKAMDNLLSKLLGLPWWLGAGFGMALVLGFDFGLPRVDIQDPALRAWAGISALVAPGLAVIALAAAAISLSRHLGYGQWLDAQSENLAYIRTFRWRRYESVLRAVYEKQGLRVIKPRRDAACSGVDLLLRKGRDQYLVCCRQWRAKIVGVKTVRALFEAMGNRSAAGGIVATCGTFTEEAKRFAAGWDIELIDGTELHRMIHAARAGELKFALKARPLAVSEPSPQIASDAAAQQPADVYDDSNVIVLYPGKATPSADIPRPHVDECVPHVVRQSR
jgi:restriction system protein